MRVVVLSLIVAGLGIGALAQAPNLELMDIVLKSIPDGPVAIVNGTPVGNQEFRDLYMGEVLRWAQLNPGEDVTDEIRLGIALNGLRMLIEREILYQEAQKRQLSIPQSELEAKWEEELQALRKVSDGDADGELSESDILERAGATRAEALAELRKALLIEAVRDAIMKEKGVTVSDADVKSWYEENRAATRRPDMLHLKQIFIQGDKSRQETKNAASRKRAEDAYKRIQSGQSFEGVAKSVSDGRYKDNGGDWGMRPVNEFPPFIVDAANKLQPGEVSQPFESEYGFHILKLVEVVAGKEVSMDDVEEDIREMLRSRKGADAIREFTSTITSDPEALQVFLDLDRQIQSSPELRSRFSKESTGE